MSPKQRIWRVDVDAVEVMSAFVIMALLKDLTGLDQKVCIVVGMLSTSILAVPPVHAGRQAIPADLSDPSQQHGASRIRSLKFPTLQKPGNELVAMICAGMCRVASAGHAVRKHWRELGLP